jgi:hypothetical protein
MEFQQKKTKTKHTYKITACGGTVDWHVVVNKKIPTTWAFLAFDA